MPRLNIVGFETQDFSEFYRYEEGNPLSFTTDTNGSNYALKIKHETINNILNRGSIEIFPGNFSITSNSKMAFKFSFKIDARNFISQEFICYVRAANGTVSLYISLDPGGNIIFQDRNYNLVYTSYSPGGNFYSYKTLSFLITSNKLTIYLDDTFEDTVDGTFGDISYLTLLNGFSSPSNDLDLFIDDVVLDSQEIPMSSIVLGFFPTEEIQNSLWSYSNVSILNDVSGANGYIYSNGPNSNISLGFVIPNYTGFIQSIRGIIGVQRVNNTTTGLNWIIKEDINSTELQNQNIDLTGDPLFYYGFSSNAYKYDFNKMYWNKDTIGTLYYEFTNTSDDVNLWLAILNVEFTSSRPEPVYSPVFWIDSNRWEQLLDGNGLPLTVLGNADQVLDIITGTNVSNLPIQVDSYGLNMTADGIADKRLTYVRPTGVVGTIYLLFGLHSNSTKAELINYLGNSITWDNGDLIVFGNTYTGLPSVSLVQPNDTPKLLIIDITPTLIHIFFDGDYLGGPPNNISNNTQQIIVGNTDVSANGVIKLQEFVFWDTSFGNDELSSTRQYFNGKYDLQENAEILPNNEELFSITALGSGSLYEGHEDFIIQAYGGANLEDVYNSGDYEEGLLIQADFFGNLDESYSGPTGYTETLSSQMQVFGTIRITDNFIEQLRSNNQIRSYLNDIFVNNNESFRIQSNFSGDIVIPGFYTESFSAQILENFYLDETYGGPGSDELETIIITNNCDFTRKFLIKCKKDAYIPAITKCLQGLSYKKIEIICRQP